MASALSEDEAACLDVAVGLLRRSDDYATTEPQLSRQYARQAYEMGRLSPRLSEAIAQIRIQMIVRNSGQSRIFKAMTATSFSGGGGLRRPTKAGLLIASFLAALVLYSTPTVKAPDQRVKLAVQLVNAPL